MAGHFDWGEVEEQVTFSVAEVNQVIETLEAAIRYDQREIELCEELDQSPIYKDHVTSHRKGLEKALEVVKAGLSK